MSDRRFSQTRRLASIALVVLGVAIAVAQLAQAAVSTRAGAASRGVLSTLTVDTPPTSVETGTRVTFTGTISPPRPERRVVLLRLIRGRWRVIAVGSVVDATGGYTITHVFRLPSGGVPAWLRIAAHRRRVFETLRVTIVRAPRRQSARHRQILEARRLRHRRAVEERERRRHQRAEARLHRRQLAGERRRHRQELAQAKRKAAEEKRNAAKEKRKRAAEERRKRAEERRRRVEERRAKALRG